MQGDQIKRDAIDAVSSGSVELELNNMKATNATATSPQRGRGDNRKDGQSTDDPDEDRLEVLQKCA